MTCHGLHWILLSALLALQGGLTTAAELPAIHLEPSLFCLSEISNAPPRLLPPPPSSLPSGFLAVVTNVWPSGLVPVFAVPHESGYELRRHPHPDEFTSAEPLFFALPPEKDPAGAALSGRWEVHAVRGDGSRVVLAWDLAADATAISGRFDQGTDYRVAEIEGGTFRTNRLDLRVKHIADRYQLTGMLKHDRLQGTWRHMEGSEDGTWEARRPRCFTLPTDLEAVNLWEYRHPDQHVRCYLLEGATPPLGWIPSKQPLCRVWRLPSSKTPPRPQ